MLMGLFCFSACSDDAEESSSAASSVESVETQGNSIEFVQNEITLSIGETVQAEVTTSKNNVYIFWSIRDKDIATVSDDGIITGVSEGQTICYASFGGVQAMCLVKVSAEKADPMLSLSTPYTNGVTLYEGDNFELSLKVKLGDELIDDAQIAYTIDNSAVVTAENGTLTACSVGSATVQITAEYEGQTASLTVAVTVVQGRAA
jgi:uncharacterized protein YjdB